MARDQWLSCYFGAFFEIISDGAIFGRVSRANTTERRRPARSRGTAGIAATLEATTLLPPPTWAFAGDEIHEARRRGILDAARATTFRWPDLKAPHPLTQKRNRSRT